MAGDDVNLTAGQRNLLKLANLLDSDVARDHFDMGFWWIGSDDDLNVQQLLRERIDLPLENATCDTSACIGGWAEILFFPERIGQPGGTIPEWEISVVLGIDYKTTQELFYPRGNDPINSRDPKWAARVVRRLASTGVVDWEAEKEKVDG